MSDQLLERVRQWVEHDPDPATRDELTELLNAATSGDEAALAELDSRFSGPLVFGTAGLRAAVGAGESRMNRAVVIRASAGLASFLVDRVGSDPLVVVGCDARHGSEDFAADAAAVFAAAGCRAVRLPAQLPTPLVAYAVRALGADAGVMVTASHNPPADNGYKVYLGARAVSGDDERGVQIVAPDDARIAERIAAAPPADEVPRDPEAVSTADDALVTDYVRRAASLRGSEEGADISIALTPMHGVGLGTARRVLEEAGFPRVAVVAEQAEPDPDFPTVAFPNPEEPGAMDLLMALAAREDADVILVGAGTVRAEGYEGPLLAPAACRRRAAEGRAPHPPVAVVSGSADLDPGSAFFAQAPVRPLVVTTDRAAREHPRRVAALAEAANVVTAGEEAVEGPALLAALAARGMRVVHGEGGPALFGSLAAADLVDELVLSIAPVLAGGSGPRVLAAPHDDGALPTRLHLVEVLHEDSMLFARYVHARHAGLLPGLDPAGVADGAPGPDREERA